MAFNPMFGTRERSCVRGAAALAAVCSVVLFNACGGGGGGESIPTTEIALDVAVADFNGDGLPDVAQPLMINRNSPGVLRVNLHVPTAGKGYLPRVDYPDGVFPTRILAASLTGGRPDLITSSSETDFVAVRLNDPQHPGTFLAPQFLGSKFAYQVAVADMNGDGHPDLLIAGNALMVALQNANSSGTFAAPTTFYANPSGNSFSALAVGDLNGDGVPDIVVADSYAVKVLFLGTSPQGLTVRQAVTLFTMSAGDNPAVGIADLNGDARNDVVIALPNSGTIVVLLQSGTVAGQFLPAETYQLPKGGAASLAIADLNGDGHLDLVSGEDFTVAVLLQDATHPGAFLVPTSYPAPLGADGIAVADIDGDGRLDVVTTSGVSSNLTNGTLKNIPGVLYDDPTKPGSFLPLQDLK